MLHKIIQERIFLAGISQAKVAEEIHTTPIQLSLYLRGEASLNNKSLERCIININVYHNRFEMAKIVASQMIKSKIPIEEVMNLSKIQMINITGIEDLDTLLDVDASTLERIIKCGLVDYEGTYPFFRMMVAHIMQLGDKATTKKAMNSWITLSSITNSIDKTNLLLGIASGVLVLGTLMQAAITILGKSGGLLSPLLSLTINSLSKKR